MTVPPCAYRDLSDEAHMVKMHPQPHDKPAPVEVHLCNWPSVNFPPAVPAWLDKLVGPGLAITPEIDCVGCPVRRERS